MRPTLKLDLVSNTEVLCRTKNKHVRECSHASVSQIRSSLKHFISTIKNKRTKHLHDQHTLISGFQHVLRQRQQQLLLQKLAHEMHT